MNILAKFTDAMQPQTVLVLVYTAHAGILHFTHMTSRFIMSGGNAFSGSKVPSDGVMEKPRRPQ